MRKFGPLLLALGVALSVIPESAAGSATLDPYELNAIIPATGAGAFLGKSYVEAFKAMELMVNSTGGIQGHPLKIVTADTQTSGQVDVQLVNGLIAKHVQVFIDGAPSTVCLPSLPLVQVNGPVDYCLSPAIHPPIGGYAFAVNGSTPDLEAVDFRYMRERGWKRIAVLLSTDSNGIDYERNLPTVMAAPENRDLKIVAQEHFANSDISVAAQLARIKSADAQALFVVTTGTPLGTVFRSLRDSGIALPVLTIAPNMTYAQMSTYGAFLPKDLYFGSLRAMTPNETMPGPLRDAQSVYLKAFQKIGVRPDAGHANAWDAMQIILSALRKLGTNASALQIRDYIVNLHGYLGVNGVYDFKNSLSGIGQNSIIIARWAPEKDTWVQVSRPGGQVK